MNDNNEKYRIELSKEEYEYVEKLKQEYYKKLENMAKDERLQYFRDNIAIENKLNFEKEINGTIYKVNTYFDENAEESILNKFFRLTKKIIKITCTIKTNMVLCEHYKLKLCNNLYHIRLSKRNEFLWDSQITKK